MYVVESRKSKSHSSRHDPPDSEVHLDVSGQMVNPFLLFIYFLFLWYESPCTVRPRGVEGSTHFRRTPEFSSTRYDRGTCRTY